jgi:flavin-dependent dehydrogenase
MVYDCLVVGSGPAGSITSRELARCGASVLMVDKATFPRPKVCGCCVNPRALETLGRVGLGDLTARLGAVPLTSLELACNGRRAVIRHPLGVAVSRESFDAALIDAAIESGVTFLPATNAALLPATSPGYRELRLRKGGRSWVARGRFVVSATGLNDSLIEDGGPAPSALGGRDRRPILGSKIGAGAIARTVPDGYTPQRIYMACAEEGYVGLVVLEDGRLDLAAALRPDAVREAAGIGPLVGRILDGARLPPVPGVAQLSWKGTPSLTRIARRLAEGRVFRVGDAAGYVEPFTGEGMAWALAGGCRLAGVLADALERDDGTAGRSWAVAYRRMVGRRQLVCHSARLALRTPGMTRSLVRVLDLCPGLATPLIRTIHRAP